MSIKYEMTNEGVGAQYQRIIGLLGIAKKHGLKFVHRKITVGHNYEDDLLWDEKWDDIFNIKSINSIVEIDKENTTTNKEVVKLFNVSNNDIDMIIKNPDKIYSITLPFNIVDNAPNIYYNIIRNDIINAYNNSNYELSLFDNDRKNIVIHIRVLNEFDNEIETIQYENLIGIRYTSYEHYMILINKLRIIYPNYNIHIISQKNISLHYKDIEKIENIKLHLDIDSKKSFHHMCNADILVIAKSSFSYLAAIYNKNKVIFFPFWHAPLDNWQNACEYMCY
jgi:hypothetical protein